MAVSPSVLSDPANRALLDLIRRNWDPTPAGEPPIVAEADWTPLVGRALHHGVGALVCRSLRALPAERVPHDIRDAAGTYLEYADAQGWVLVAQLLEILDVLAAAGIPALPYKGPVLGVLAYDSATVRSSRDIDVLVHRGDMARTVSTLGVLGYRMSESLSPRVMAACHRSYGQDILFARDRTSVEPHWAFAPRALAVDLDMRAIWNRARIVRFAGRNLPALALEDAVLTTCLHGSKEKWWRLLWVADVAGLVHRHPALDWDALLERAQACGIRRMLLLGLALARELFATALPDAIDAAIERDATCLQLVRQSERHLFGGAAAVGSVHRVSRYHLQSRERVFDRVRYVWRTMTTPQFMHYRMLKLPDRLAFGYVGVKLVHDYALLPLWRLGKGLSRRRAHDPAPGGTG